MNLYLLRGLPGSGKTTIAQSLKPDAMFAADDYFLDEQGNYNFDPTKLPVAHDVCKTNCRDAMEDGLETIVIHNTFTQEWEMNPYYRMAGDYGYRVHSLIVENRHGGKNVHDVPESAMDKMERRFSVKLR